MHLRLFVARLVVAEIGVLLQRLPDSANNAVPEDSEAPGKEGHLHAVTLHVLLLEEGDQGLRHGQPPCGWFAH